MKSQSNRSRRSPLPAARSGWAAFLALCLVTPAQAFQPLVTDDTGTQGEGGNQIELAGTRSRASGDTARDIAFVYTRGVTESLDVFVEAGRQRLETGGNTIKGPVNTALGAKWRFYENDASNTSLALKPIYLVPLSAGQENDGLGTGKSSYELSLILTQETGWGALHANLLTSRANYRDSLANPHERTRQFSVAPVWNVAADWKLAADLGISRTRAGGATEQTRFGELGAIYSPNEDFDLALGFIREKNRDSGVVTNTATAGVTWRFK